MEKEEAIKYHTKLKKIVNKQLFKILKKIDMILLNYFYYSKYPINQKGLVSKLSKDNKSVSKVYVSMRCNFLESLELISRAKIRQVWSGKAGSLIDKRCRFYEITGSGEDVIEFYNESFNKQPMPTLWEYTTNVDKESS